MKFQTNNEIIIELTEVQKKVIQNEIPSEIFEEDMKRRVHYIINHKYERCLERLKQEWLPKLSSRVANIPTNEEELANLIFSQQDYKNRSQKELEAREE